MCVYMCMYPHTIIQIHKYTCAHTPTQSWTQYNHTHYFLFLPHSCVGADNVCCTQMLSNVLSVPTTCPSSEGFLVCHCHLLNTDPKVHITSRRALVDLVTTRTNFLRREWNGQALKSCLLLSRSEGPSYLILLKRAVIQTEVGSGSQSSLPSPMQKSFKECSSGAVV